MRAGVVTVPPPRFPPIGEQDATKLPPSLAHSATHRANIGPLSGHIRPRSPSLTWPELITDSVDSGPNSSRRSTVSRHKQRRSWPIPVSAEFARNIVDVRPNLVELGPTRNRPKFDRRRSKLGPHRDVASAHSLHSSSGAQGLSCQLVVPGHHCKFPAEFSIDPRSGLQARDPAIQRIGGIFPKKETSSAARASLWVLQQFAQSHGHSSTCHIECTWLRAQPRRSAGRCVHRIAPSTGRGDRKGSLASVAFCSSARRTR